HTDSPWNHHAFRRHTRVVHQRNHDRSQLHSVRSRLSGDLVFPRGPPLYRKTTFLFVSRSEWEGESRRCPPGESPDSDFSSLSRRTSFLLPSPQKRSPDSCPSPDLRN